MKPKKTSDLESDSVIHPLFDVPEQKLDPLSVGPMRMTTAVKWSLTLLRVYLLAMVVLVAYRALNLGGALK